MITIEQYFRKGYSLGCGRLPKTGTGMSAGGVVESGAEYTRRSIGRRMKELVQSIVNNSKKSADYSILKEESL